MASSVHFRSGLHLSRFHASGAHGLPPLLARRLFSRSRGHSMVIDASCAGMVREDCGTSAQCRAARQRRR